MLCNGAQVYFVASLTFLIKIIINTLNQPAKTKACMSATTATIQAFIIMLTSRNAG